MAALRTPLYDQHLASSAKMVDFHGWLLPIHYGSQIEEHHAVRKHCGLFDVSHMTIVDFDGPGIEAFLRYLLANDVAKLTKGKAFYSMMLNERGGIIDDLIVYRGDHSCFRIVFNAATRDSDLDWIQKQVESFDVTIQSRVDLANLALQGPDARKALSKALPDLADQIKELKPFRFFLHENWQIACTGYTGEDGLEIILPQKDAITLWEKLIKAGVQPCGLGARDTLRLEAGLNLYGLDMDESVTPLESNVAWTVAWEPNDRDFIGRAALEAQKKENTYRQLVGILLEDRGVLRAGQPVFQNNQEIGLTVSGTFSPTIEQGIAFARIGQTSEKLCEVEVRGKKLKAKIIKLPFVRHGKVLVSSEN